MAKAESVPTRVHHSPPPGREFYVNGIPIVITRGVKGGRRIYIAKHSLTSVIRWMGKRGWGAVETRRVLEQLGLSDVGDSTILTQLYGGRCNDPTKRGIVPTLGKEYEKQLTKMRESLT